VPAYNYNTLIADAATVIAATWTDVVANGIWELDEAMRQSWEERTLPFASFELGTPEAAEWGVVNNAHEVELKVHYIALESAGMSTVRTKLTALESAMFVAGAFTASSATLFAETRLDWSPENPINAIAYAKNIPVCAGTITFRFVCGTSVN
jgi:hypothetical protein